MKIAIVTGASSGIGREFVLQLDKAYKNLDEIWVVARRTERLRELEKQVATSIRIFDGDLSRDYIFEKIQKELERKEADVRMLILAAGYGKMGLAEQTGADELLGMIDLNCRALTRMVMICLPFLSKGSRILPIASAAAFSPQPGFAVYAATKAYVYSFSVGLRTELTSKGIYVTVVCPGPVDTEFFDKAGSLPRIGKISSRAEAAPVVRQAIKDSRKRRTVSIYGTPMRMAWIAAKVVPYGVSAAFMKWFNRIG